MYDYATVTKQNQIIDLLTNLNNNIVIYSETFQYLIILVCVILLGYFLGRFFLRCLGK